MVPLTAGPVTCAPRRGSLRRVRIVWSEEARKTLLPRSREHAKAVKWPPARPAWERLKREARQPEQRFVNGRSLAAPPLASIMERCGELMTLETPPAAWDVDTAAALMALLYPSAHTPILASVMHTSGLPGVVRVVLRSLELTAETVRDPKNHWAYVLRTVTRTPGSDRLRAPLLAATDAVRAECKEVARAAWDGASLGQKTTLAYAFFEEERWTDEVTRAWMTVADPPQVDILYPIVRDMDAVRAFFPRRQQSRSFLELVETFGDAALPLLTEVFEAPRDEFERWHAARALALFDDPAAARLLASQITKTKVRPSAAEFFARFPHHAAEVLAPLAKGKGRIAKLAAELVAGARRAAAAEQGTAVAAPEAAAEELPAILREPPWTLKKRPKKPSLRVPGGVTPVLHERIAIDPQIAREVLEEAAVLARGKPEMNEAQRAAYLERVRGKGSYVDPVLHDGGDGPARVPDDLQLTAWNESSARVMDRQVSLVAYFLARFGAEAMPGVLVQLEKSFTYRRDDPHVLFGVDSTRIVPALVKVHGYEVREPVVRDWMRLHPRTALLGLLPLVFGGEKVPGAAPLLWALVHEDGADVRAAADEYGPEMRRVVDDWLAWDRRFDVPKKLPKMPGTWRPETFRRPLLEGGKALPLAAVETLGVMLRLSPPGRPYPGLAEVKEACEPRSLAELSWDMARAWDTAGGKTRDVWMRNALVHLADDEVVRRLTPAMRADRFVAVLEAIGTDAAVMELLTIAGRAPGSSWMVDPGLRRLARARGVTPDELEESVIPTLGVDARGQLSLQHGDRPLRVGFDSRLEPHIVDEETGGKLRALPRATGDPEAVETAKRIWADLKEDVAVLATRRLAALERAMLTRRTWTREDFERTWVHHPLMVHVARGLVWTSEGRSFRIAEDRTYAGPHDAAVELGPTVQLYHPAVGTPEEREAWRQILADYEIVQGFLQVERGRSAPPQGNTSGDPGNVIEQPVPAWRCADLETRLLARGFQRGSTRDKVRTLKRDLYGRRGEVRLVCEFDEEVSHVQIGFWRKQVPLPVTTIHPVDVAEALFDLAPG